MRKKTVSALALALATAFPDGAFAFDARLEGMVEPESAPTKPKTKAAELPVLGSGISIVALIAGGLAGAALAAAGGGGGGGGGSTASASTDGGGTDTSKPPPRPMNYTSAADFRTPEYNAQHGLGMVKAETLYYNGHQRWSTWDAPDPAAGTGVGVKIAVADTGIDAREAGTSSTIRIDVIGSYDYVANRAGSGADDYGHGTHVAGIIAAPKNGAGMHGLAYNASVVNYKIGDANGFIIAGDAQLADMMQRAANAGAMILNNSWGTQAAITSFSTEEVQSIFPRWIDASRSYIAKGGVVVFAAGNDMTTQPSLQAGLPYRVSGLEPGWLAVVAIDDSGRLATYSNHCGVAARWCLAAPGGAPETGLFSMYKDGSYAAMYGTSMAAPHAAAALGALKSMFPNLSYLQLRDRLLYTANKSGAYAEATVYGAGLMDLAAASSPVDGIAFPTATSANGTTASVSGTGIEFPAGALRALGMQGAVLVVDNYQRAPFWVPAQSSFRETAPRLIERQWASLRSAARSPQPGAGSSLRFSHAAGLNSVVSADLATYRLGFSTGAGGEAILGSHLELAWIPGLAAPGLDSVALGYSSHVGRWRIGLLGSLPSVHATGERTVESSSLGSRRALGFVAQQRAGATTYGASFALAEHFERPIGMATGGAFGIDESAAISSGMFVEHALGPGTTVKSALEVAHHRSEASGTLSTPAYAMRSAMFGARTMLGPKTTLSADVKREWSGSEAARLHVPLTINENGDIGRVTYALAYDELVGRTSLTLRVDHELTKRIALRAGLTHERYGFGVSATGIAAIFEVSN